MTVTPSYSYSSCCSARGSGRAKQHGRDRKKEKAAVPITEAKRPNDQLALLDSAANAGLSMLAVDNNKCFSSCIKTLVYDIAKKEGGRQNPELRMTGHAHIIQQLFSEFRRVLFFLFRSSSLCVAPFFANGKGKSDT
ncbi:hypothetical protein OUZ56_000298 [Daphnia magna]|uniref:Uncharacterized protein n=1 Tax=Daphnia magna TaxID=35525 RepID=A0ABQ9ZZ92_9CRUS|nr:hypothetical protein OUZ56_000298 [Daphnia magna]